MSSSKASSPTRSARQSNSRWWARLLENRFGGVLLLFLVFVSLSWAMRLVLLEKAGGQVSWDASLAAVAAWGTLFDVAGTALWSLPLTLVLLVLPRRFFHWRWGRGFIHVAAFAMIALIMFGCVAEWFFWDEFGARFNFIAVDYLVYTSEVIGNIRESYPMPLVFTGIFTGALLIHVLVWRTGWPRRWFEHADAPLRARLGPGAACLAIALGIGLLPNQEWLPTFQNNYNRELAKNGPWSFFAAFRANQLDFEQFYTTIPMDEAFQRVREIIAQDDFHALGRDRHELTRLIRNPGPERHLNVVQITVESLSAKFLTRYGGQENLTPNLDALIPHALVFDNFYATGNRTVRGMEALTLSVPPTPGRSLVKRPHNENLFTLGSIFRERDYATAFLYGGYGYFDNMNYFFGHNGYRIVDRATWDKDEITFANAWGACDEDLYHRTLREADTDTAAGKPFHYFLMTTSNHRPFTFPDGRIDLPSKDSHRRGGVKYTDYAIGKFLRDAAEKPWYKHTIFVIVADHCASSAGKTELPVQNYHIPLIIYAPGGQVAPGVVSTLCSQMDFAPTLLGLLHWTYASRFYGCDLLALAPGTPGRALIANYQKLGLYTPGKLTVLEPVRRTGTYAYDKTTNELSALPPDPAMLHDAIAYYESAGYLFEHDLQGEYAGPSATALSAATVPAK